MQWPIECPFLISVTNTYVYFPRYFYTTEDLFVLQFLLQRYFSCTLEFASNDTDIVVNHLLT